MVDHNLRNASEGTRVKRSIALLLATLIFLQPGPTRLEALQQQQKKQGALTDKDSLKALNRAVQSLRGYERQLALLRMQGARPRRGIYGPMYEKRANWAFNSYRDSLFKILKIIPRDRWIHGELVRFPLQRSNPIGAMDNLKNCQADDWYCNGLRAFLIQIVGALPRSADSAWTSVIPQMPAIERCAWLDPWAVSSDKFVAEQVQAMTCEDRERIANRVWWLSDPLWSREGNERRAEHLTRHMDLFLRVEFSTRATMNPAMVLRSEAPPSDSSVLYRLDPDVMLQYAPWRLVYPWGYYERAMRTGTSRPMVRGTMAAAPQTLPQRVSFVPKGAVFTDHLHARADDWNLYARPDDWNPRGTPAFESMLGWNTPINAIPFQIAYFQRGADARIVAVTDVSRDTALTSLKPAAVMMLQRDFDRPLTTLKGTGGPVYRFDFLANTDSTLASIEVVASNGTAGRVRLAIGPQPMPSQRVTMSDLLLVEPAAVLPLTLEQAEPVALGTTALADSSTVGVFWEMYDVNASDSVSFELIASRIRTTSLGNTLRNILGGARPDSLAILWQEAPTSRTAVEPRAINLSLNMLSPGRYSLSLAIDVPGQQRVVSRREIEILNRR